MTTTLTALHIIGQIILGGFFVYNGIKHFMSHVDYTDYATSLAVPAPASSVFFTGILLVVGGLGIIFNVYIQVALIILIIFLVPTTLMMHAFWNLDNPGEKSSQKIQFLKNSALVGALLLLF